MTHPYLSVLSQLLGLLEERVFRTGESDCELREQY